MTQPRPRRVQVDDTCSIEETVCLSQLRIGELAHSPVAALGRHDLEREAWRDGPQPSLSRLLDGCWIEPLDEPGARGAGQLLGRAQSADAVDDSVVVGALRRGDAVVTSERRDIETLANAVGRRICVIAV